MNYDPPLSLEHYCVSHLQLACDPKPDALPVKERLVHVVADNTKAEVHIGIADKNKDLFKLDMNLTAQSRQHDYHVTIVAFALILVRSDFPESDRLKLLQINGASMLYGALRDFVLTVTGRTLLPPLYLPTLRFVSGADGTQTVEPPTE